MKVYWTPFKENPDVLLNWINVVYPEPENAYKYLTRTRGKDTEYFRCPAVRDYFKNTFVMKAPLDLTFSVINGEMRTYNYGQEFFNQFMTRKTKEGDAHETLILNWDYVFYSDEPCIMEQLPAFMVDSKLQRSIRLIPGTFDISKWIRPVQMSFEVIDPREKITIKRGEPLYYVRLLPKDGSKITLERADNHDYIREAVSSIVTVKDLIRNLSLKENYEMAKSYLAAWRRGRDKKSKCPFHFWK